MKKELRTKLGIKIFKRKGLSYVKIGEIIRKSKKKVKSVKKSKSVFSTTGVASTTFDYKPKVNIFNIFKKLINKIYEIIRHFQKKKVNNNH